jgi:hypothetical protein
VAQPQLTLVAEAAGLMELAVVVTALVVLEAVAQGVLFQ